MIIRIELELPTRTADKGCTGNKYHFRFDAGIGHVMSLESTASLIVKLENIIVRRVVVRFILEVEILKLG